MRTRCSIAGVCGITCILTAILTAIIGSWGCTQPGDPAPPDATAAQAEPAALKPPEIRLKEVSPNQISTGYKHLTFEVHNPNDVALPYSGYTQNSFDPPLTAKTIAPLYHAEFERDGEWVPEELGWCGVGIGSVELPPHSKLVFDFPANLDEWTELRVAISWGDPRQEQQKWQTAWSESVKRESIER